MDKALKYPLVSVIMPVYNCGRYIEAAIESILNQSYANLEFVIIDDCSTDNTREVIGAYTDNRIVFLKKEENTGYISSLNLGIELSKGLFLARMDGDDISHSERLSKQVGFLSSNPGIVLCGTWYELMSTNERVEYPVENEAIKISLLDFCALGHPTVMFRKEFLIENQLRYDQLFYPAEDYELWTRIAAIGQMANIPEVLLSYRLHEEQVSQTAQSAQLKNSFLCRSRMMCYPIKNPLRTDLATAELIVTNERIKEQGRLKEVVSWLNSLLAVNQETGFYDQGQLQRYIVLKKGELIRRYYLNTTSYSPAVFIFFNREIEYLPYFTPAERIKLLLKCMVFWK
jgi:glycosyltransferase involved in cell wall biosynthesis